MHVPSTEWLLTLFLSHAKMRSTRIVPFRSVPFRGIVTTLRALVFDFQVVHGMTRLVSSREYFAVYIRSPLSVAEVSSPQPVAEVSSPQPVAEASSPQPVAVESGRLSSQSSNRG
jgi:hypothetical protein